MAEETVIRPEPVVTSEAPRTQLSAAEIAQPYQMLGRSLDKLGEGLEQLAVPFAERAGAQAVTRDAQGNIQVEHVPIFGDAGAAYARAVKMGALAEGEGAAKRADIELRQQFRDDPQGYQNAAQAYKDKTVQQYTDAAGPEVGLAVGQAIDNTTTYTYRGLLNEKERLDLQRAEGRMNDGVKDATDDLMALARQNAPTDGNDWKTASDKLTALLNEKASNPRLAYSQEQRAFDLQKIQGDLAGQRWLYHVDQTYKDQGVEAALKDAESIRTDPAYAKLTPAQRDKYYHQAVTEVRANNAIRQQDVAAVNEQYNGLRDRVAVGERVDPTEIQAVRNAYEKLGNAAGMARVDAAFAHKDLHDAYGQRPLNEQTNELHTIRGAAAARDIYQGLRQRGYSEAAAAGIAGNIVFESGGRPGVFGDQGTSAGLAQWHAERLAALKSYASSQGKDWRDPDTQLNFLDRELRTTESVTGGLLRTATTPEQAAAMFAAGFERPEGHDYTARQALARSIFEGRAADGSAGPGATSWLVANRAATLKTSATKQYDAIKADWDAGKGFSHQDIGDVVDAARETNNIDLMAKAEQLGRAQDYVEQSKVLPLDQQRATEAEIRRQLAISPTAGADLVVKQLEARTEAIQKGLEKDPIATTLGNFPDKFKTPAPLNTADPAQFIAGLQMRAQIAQFAANNWRVPPVSALDDADVQTVKAALSTPDLAKKAAVWGALATLPENVRGPTFEKIAKGDPNTRAEAGAGSMMSSDPEMAKSIMAGLQIMRSDDKGVLKQFEPKAGGTEGFDVDLAKKLPATAFGSERRLDPEGNYATMGQMIKGRYAYLAANDTRGAEYSSARLDQAITDVTGGMVRLNGAKTIAPERGMSQVQFDGVMAGVTDSELAGVTSLNGQPISANYLRSQGHLEAIGPGQYMVNFAGPGEKPIYAYSGWGDMPGGVQRFVLDLTGRKPAGPQPALPYSVTPADVYMPPVTPGPSPLSRSARPPAAPAYDEHMQPPTIGVRG